MLVRVHGVIPDSITETTDTREDGPAPERGLSSHRLVGNDITADTTMSERQVLYWEPTGLLIWAGLAGRVAPT
jgi:hypothetical protein